MKLRRATPRPNVFRALLLLAAGATLPALTGCLAVGYSSGGGWFVWPGGLGLLIVVIVVVMLLRRR